MATSKKSPDLTGLVATKGSAAPVADVPARSPQLEDTDTNEKNLPLNFRVSGEFRRRFRMFAAANDLKLSELLRLSFDEYEKKH